MVVFCYNVATMEKPNLPSPHNNYFHFALSHLPNARSLIESQLPAAALRELKLETLGIRFNLAFAVATLRTGYNGKGELTGYTYPDGTAVGRNYTARGELYQLSRAGTTIDTRVYDNGGP